MKQIHNRTKQAVLSSEASKEVECFSASTDNVIYWNMCTLVRTAVGWENPRLHYEASVCRMTLDPRQRQLHDEDKSCGTQPAYIRIDLPSFITAVLSEVHILKGGHIKR